MYKVMLIDDEESLHMAIEKLLTKNGYEYCGATDAESGMEMLAAEKPDLLLLDVMLPGMNGFDLCTRIRAEIHIQPWYDDIRGSDFIEQTLR